MKISKKGAHHQVRSLPVVRFENKRLTPYAGLVVFQALFHSLRLTSRLAACFEHLPGRVYGYAKMFLALVVHVLLGFRRLRGLTVYENDPFAARVVGLRQMPSVATLSRTLAKADERSTEKVRALGREFVLDRLRADRVGTVTLDFDGTTQLTSGTIEGTAVGYNKVKHGQRSYYPLFVTVAQTGQFFDMLHRPGNAHDSAGAGEFMQSSFTTLRQVLPAVRREARMDAAFFSEPILEQLDRAGVAFSCSVPFERMPKLKQLVEQATWKDIDQEWAFAEPTGYRPTTWSYGGRFRFVLVRRRTYKQRKDIVPAPEQLDLFQPVSRDYRYRVIVTNKKDKASQVLEFHNGRCAQEKIFGEAKQHTALDVIVARRRTANELFTAACMYAHNLARELQMRQGRRRIQNTKRRTLYRFLSLGALRLRQIFRAAILSRPKGRLVMTVGADGGGRDEFLRSLSGALGTMQH